MRVVFNLKIFQFEKYFSLKNISAVVPCVLIRHDMSTTDARGQISVRNRWVDTPGPADSSFVTKLISEIEKLQHKL